MSMYEDPADAIEEAILESWDPENTYAGTMREQAELVIEGLHRRGWVLRELADIEERADALDRRAP